MILGALGGIKAQQIGVLMKFGADMQKAGPPPEVVSTAVAEEQSWEGTLAAVGSVATAKGVSIGNEVAGTVSAIRFESGATVKQGQVLVELDSSVERANLASAQARKQLAIVNAERSRQLIASGAIPKAQLDTDESALRSAIADVGSLQAQIDKKTIRAPFSGRLGIRLVNLGQYLTAGTAITDLQSVDALYVDFSLPQQRIGDVAVGMPVRVTVDGAGKPVEGVIAAVEPTIDAASRNIKLRATVSAKDDRIRPGMFVNVSVVLPAKATRVIVPATAVVHASYGNSVFVVEDKKDEAGKVVAGPDGKPLKVVRQQFVKLGESRGDFVAILDGVKPGQELVSAGAFKLRNGAGIAINNKDVKITPQLAPKPENR